MIGVLLVVLLLLKVTRPFFSWLTGVPLLLCSQILCKEAQKLNTSSALLFFLLLTLSPVVSAQSWETILTNNPLLAQSLNCGLKPLPEIGCQIGQCVNGKWEQVCSSSRGQATNLSCGIKPLPQIGCRIGRCVNGSWQQVCSNTRGQPTNLSCGIKPLPMLGCRIGQCINGQWQQVCN